MFAEKEKLSHFLTLQEKFTQFFVTFKKEVQKELDFISVKLTFEGEVYSRACSSKLVRMACKNVRHARIQNEIFFLVLISKFLISFS